LTSKKEVVRTKKGIPAAGWGAGRKTMRLNAKRGPIDERAVARESKAESCLMRPVASLMNDFGDHEESATQWAPDPPFRIHTFGFSGR
jgi:hypothetical protein